MQNMLLHNRQVFGRILCHLVDLFGVNDSENCLIVTLIRDRGRCAGCIEHGFALDKISADPGGRLLGSLYEFRVCGGYLFCRTLGSFRGPPFGARHQHACSTPRSRCSRWYRGRTAFDPQATSALPLEKEHWPLTEATIVHISKLQPYSKTRSNTQPGRHTPQQESNTNNPSQVILLSLYAGAPAAGGRPQCAPSPSAPPPHA